MNRLQLWSDIPGQLFKASTESDATGQAEVEKGKGDTVLVERLNSLNDLIRLFTRLCQKDDVWDSVNFHTHGSGGSIALGSNSLDLDSYFRLENQDFERMFAKGCIITFDGCNVAEGCAGEFFLIEIAITLLATIGGKVRGNTGAGFGTFFGGESFHPLGGWVTAIIEPGGTIRLENGTHLHTGNIQARISALHSKIADCDRRHLFRPGEKGELEQAEQVATIWAAQGSFRARFKACIWLDDAEDKIGKIQARFLPPHGI